MENKSCRVCRKGVSQQKRARSFKNQRMKAYAPHTLPNQTREQYAPPYPTLPSAGDSMHHHTQPCQTREQYAPPYPTQPSAGDSMHHHTLPCQTRETVCTTIPYSAKTRKTYAHTVLFRKKLRSRGITPCALTNAGVRFHKAVIGHAGVRFHEAVIGYAGVQFYKTVIGYAGVRFHKAVIGYADSAVYRGGR